MALVQNIHRVNGLEGWGGSLGFNDTFLSSPGRKVCAILVRIQILYPAEQHVTSGIVLLFYYLYLRIMVI